MRLTDKNGSRKIAIYALYSTIKESEEKYQEKQHECEIYNKLADLEDLEEELGIDLITLYKALKNGVYVKPTYNCFDLQKGVVKFLSSHSLSVDGFGSISYKPYEEDSYNQFHFDFKGYGTFWALTKEELE